MPRGTTRGVASEVCIDKGLFMGADHNFNLIARERDQSRLSLPSYVCFTSHSFLPSPMTYFPYSYTPTLLPFLCLPIKLHRLSYKDKPYLAQPNLT